ncbi:MAG: hypothetical protein KAH54_11010 [Candidatus Sabulitectum sp.]|nr:hypothetical protein [Candidatus Sabulitectum sp.]
MRAFVFHKEPVEKVNDICGTTPLKDLVIHLQNSGVTEIYSDCEENHEGVIRCDFPSAEKQLRSGWLAAFSGCITRQSPAELRNRTLSLGADMGASLACSAKPWKHTTVLTDGNGFMERVESNPSPECSETNLCFSGMIWVNSGSFDPGDPSRSALLKTGTAAFLLPGFWMCPDDRDSFLLTVHQILQREAYPWPHLSIPNNGIISHSLIPGDMEIKGTLWVGSNCLIGSGCTLENCVLLDGSSVGKNSNLRNCLVMAGTRIPENTIQYDKHLSLLGDENAGKN